MESLIVFVSGVMFGLMFGVMVGRRSIVKEAQALVAETILEIRDKYETKRNDRQAVHRTT
jgi:hypothetical protein